MGKYHVIFCIKECAEETMVNKAFDNWSMRHTYFDTREMANEAAMIFSVTYGELFYETQAFRVYKLELKEENLKFQFIGKIINIERYLLGARTPTTDTEVWACEKRIDELLKKDSEELRILLLMKEDEYYRVAPAKLINSLYGSM